MCQPVPRPLSSFNAQICFRVCRSRSTSSHSVADDLLLTNTIIITRTVRFIWSWNKSAVAAKIVIGSKRDSTGTQTVEIAASWSLDVH